MSAHLLREILDLNTTVGGGYESTDLSNYLSPDKKNIRYYSTDKGRNVVTQIPSHMKIIHNFPSSSSVKTNTNDNYTDDNYTDVSARLLNKVTNKPMTFYSTDKGKYVTQMVPEKMNVIKNVYDLPKSSSFSDAKTDVSARLLNKVTNKPITFYSTDEGKYVTKMVPENIKVIKDVYDLTNSSLLSNSESDSNNSYSNSFRRKFPSIYSDIELSDKDTIYSNDFSNKSSFKSDNTSYDSFFDILQDYTDQPKPKTFSEMITESNLDELINLNETEDSDDDNRSSSSSFNIFKSKHRQ
jgi:hypothetical protein